MENNELSKEEILKELILDEKDTLQKLRELVEKSKVFIKIEGDSGKIVFMKSNLPLKDKIILLLIGKYFSKELGLSDSNKLNFEEIKNSIGAESQALSRPLGTLLKENIIEKDEDRYLIKYYQIQNCLDNIGKAKPKSEMRRRVKRSANVKSDEKGLKNVKKLIPESIIKLAEKVNIDEKKLKHIFEIEENDVRIITQVEGESELNRQLTATLLYLVTYKYCFGLQEIESSDLLGKLQDLGIHSLVNLSTNLKRYHNFIVHKMTQRGSTLTRYRLTTPGEIEGLKLIKEIGEKICNGD